MNRDGKRGYSYFHVHPKPVNLNVFNVKITLEIYREPLIHSC